MNAREMLLDLTGKARKIFGIPESVTQSFQGGLQPQGGVIAPDVVCHVWRMGNCYPAHPNDQKTIEFYCEDTLRYCNEQNQRGLACWRLVYVNGLSFREQVMAHGIDTSSIYPTQFTDEAAGLIMNRNEYAWAGKSEHSRFHLVNVRPSLVNVPNQIDAIRNLRDTMKCPSSVVLNPPLESALCEIAFTLFVVNNERILSLAYDGPSRLNGNTLRLILHRRQRGSMHLFAWPTEEKISIRTGVYLSIVPNEIYTIQ